MSRRNDGLTCTAKAKSTQKRCGNPPIRGGTVCKFHGGGAPQVKAVAARAVFEALVGPALMQYRRIIEAPDVDDRVKLAALRDLFDRTGYKPPVQVEFISDAAIEADIKRIEDERGI